MRLHVARSLIGIVLTVFAGAGLANGGIVVSEFRTRGPSGAADEFIELYNNSDGAVDISGWKINGSNSGGSTSTRLTINAGTTIAARGHFLATNSSASGYSGGVAGNQTYTTGITDDGGIALVMPDGVTIVDQVGMSAGSAYKEGATLTPLTTNTDQSYERKPGGASGSTQDTNDNASDFSVRVGSDPQNLSSPPTPYNLAPGVVTNTNDSGPGSLRQILADAVDGDTITFALTLPATITLTSGELLVARSVTIAGPGPDKVTVDANYTGRVFHISSGQTDTISGLTIAHGFLSAFVGSGSGVFNDQASLIVSHCIVSGNYTYIGFGGISNTGTLTINNSTISGNTSDAGEAHPEASGKGGGIGNSGTLTVNNSTISGNNAISCCTLSGGGGIENVGTLTINNSTVSGNWASGSGGGIANFGTLAINNSTISDNYIVANQFPTAGVGGGIYNSTSAAGVSLRNTILKTGSSGENIYNNSGTVTSNGYNLSNDNGGGFLTATGDQINTDPKLDPNGLQNNGGPTQTIALQSISPAINSGDPNAPARDQRYYLRNGAPDKGAYEYAGTLAPITAGSRKAHGSAGSFDVDLPLSGTPGIECRSGGMTNDHQVVLTFATPVSVNGNPQAQMTTGIGQVGSGGTANGGVVNADNTGTIVTVPLTNVSNGQRVVVTLFNVSDGINANNVAIPMAVLIGDTNSDTFVDSADIAQTKSKSGQTTNATNFREDINKDEFLDSADIAFVKSKSGTALPSAVPAATEATRSKKTRSRSRVSFSQ